METVESKPVCAQRLTELSALRPTWETLSIEASPFEMAS
jgi:hypothetical protein